MKPFLSTIKARCTAFVLGLITVAGPVYPLYAQESRDAANAQPAPEAVSTSSALDEEVLAADRTALTELEDKSEIQKLHEEVTWLKQDLGETKERVQLLEFQLGTSQTPLLTSTLDGDLPTEPSIAESGLESDLIIGEGGLASPIVDDRWKINFGLELWAYYDDNLYLVPFDETDDFIFVISPAVSLGRGDLLERKFNFINLFYQPALILFVENSEEDALDHDALAEVFFNFGKTELLTTARYQRLSGSENEASGRADRDLFTGSVRLEHHFTLKTSASFEHDTILTDYSDREVDSNEYIFRAFLNYRSTEKTRVGIGGVYGYLDVKDASHQTYQQALVRLDYTPSPKFLMAMRAGVELRQYEDADKASPRLSASFQWFPYVNTTVFGQAFIRERNSAVFEDQNYRNYGGELGLRQKFLQKFEFTLAGGYENLDYVSASTGEDLTREDDYVFGRASLAYKFRSWLTAELFYQYRENFSNDDLEDWENNQTGVRVALEF